MQAGADLMTPGLQRGPPFPQKATKGAIVAIASLEAPTVPMAVGTCEIDVSALQQVQGVKGMAVSTFHWAGDELWSWSSTSKPGVEPPEVLKGWDDEQDEDSSLAERTAAVDLDDQEGSIPLEPAERSEAEKAQGIQGEDAPSSRDFVDVVDEKELTTKGMFYQQLSST
jgi:translation initiation factor 2D